MALEIVIKIKGPLSTDEIETIIPNDCRTISNRFKDAKRIEIRREGGSGRIYYAIISQTSYDGTIKETLITRYHEQLHLP